MILFKSQICLAILSLWCVLAILWCVQVIGERAPTWDECGCSWDSWKPWSSCTKTCGGGYQHRSRSVWTKCDDFSDCATTGTEYQSCNGFCFNMGTFIPQTIYYGLCVCKIGWKGSCCEQEVNCGTPSDISHGRYNGTKFTYGNQITYYCDTNYNMTDPSAAVRTCTEYGYWSGRLPRCEYATSCNSSPCKNGADCINILGGYQCVCLEGWTGKDCEIDIQPPVVQNCPEHREIFTAEMTSVQQWQEPTFIDPHGQDVHISKNYPTSSFEFPWGVFSVIYTAVKPLNGLTTSCIFNISVKPFQCEVLSVPKNGFLVCNGWNTDYASICKLFCKSGFAYPPGFKSEDWYTCGSSGHWLPAIQLSECLLDVVSIGSADETFPDCDKQLIGEYYIQRLKASQFNDLCESDKASCNADKVNVSCY